MTSRRASSLRNGPSVAYWGTGYDWRKAEAKLNALPQFVTNINGSHIYFIHVRSSHPHALPVIITHGWPGSVLEQLKVIAPRIRPHMADVPKMRSMSLFRRCRVTVFPASRRPRMGTRSHCASLG